MPGFPDGWQQHSTPVSVSCLYCMLLEDRSFSQASSVSHLSVSKRARNHSPILTGPFYHILWKTIANQGRALTWQQKILI
jgi:hypothetical protein